MKNLTKSKAIFTQLYQTEFDCKLCAMAETESEAVALAFGYLHARRQVPV